MAVAARVHQQQDLGGLRVGEAPECVSKEKVCSVMRLRVYKTV